MNVRFDVVRRGLFVGVLALGVGAPPVARAADLVVGAFGGIWEQSLRRCMVDPWSKATGKTVDVVLGTPTQWLNQIAASKGKPPLDVIYMPSESAYDAIGRGLVDRFSAETVPNAQSVAAQFIKLGDGYGVPHNYGGMGIMYNAKTVPNPPKTWKEFVEGTIAGKWKASMPTISYPSAGFTVSVWWFAKQFGGGTDNIEPGSGSGEEDAGEREHCVLERSERGAERDEKRRYRHGAVLGWAGLCVHR